MDDKTFRRDYADLPTIVDLDRIKDPVSRMEFEEMEKDQRELERLNREVDAELRQAGLI